MKKFVYLLFLIIIIISGAWLLLYKYEGDKPVIDVSLPSLYLKKNYEMSLDISDNKTGLREIMVTIQQKNKVRTLLKKQYEAPGITDFFSKENTLSDSFVIPVNARQYGMTDGDAVIKITLSDYAWKDWNKGNVTQIEKKVVIDSEPPKITILTRRHNVEKGGSGLIIYQLFEENIKSGIKVGDNYFPGHHGLFENSQIHTAFFALTDTQGPGTRMVVEAEDPAGNVTSKGFYHYIRDAKFKTDTLNIPDSFLERKIPQFDVGHKISGGKKHQNPLVPQFIHINRKIRKENVDKILKTPAVSENKKYWNGRFSRLRGSARRAGFADRRIYRYKGKEIDRAVHYGIDLASTTNAAVSAANAGRVIMAEFVGIFGNSVMIDHGFGLCSLYSHLSSMNVQTGDEVKKGEQIGLSGLTGLAGGDHLHFSMIVHNVFVNPVEWWDKTWIKNNITSKIDYIHQLNME